MYEMYFNMEKSGVLYSLKSTTVKNVNNKI